MLGDEQPLYLPPRSERIVLRWALLVTSTWEFHSSFARSSLRATLTTLQHYLICENAAVSPVFLRTGRALPEDHSPEVLSALCRLAWAPLHNLRTFQGARTRHRALEQLVDAYRGDLAEAEARRSPRAPPPPPLPRYPGVRFLPVRPLQSPVAPRPHRPVPQSPQVARPAYGPLRLHYTDWQPQPRWTAADEAGPAARASPYPSGRGLLGFPLGIPHAT